MVFPSALLQKTLPFDTCSISRVVPFVPADVRDAPHQQQTMAAPWAYREDGLLKVVFFQIVDMRDNKAIAASGIDRDMVVHVSKDSTQKWIIVPAMDEMDNCVNILREARDSPDKIVIGAASQYDHSIIKSLDWTGEVLSVICLRTCIPCSYLPLCCRDIFCSP